AEQGLRASEERLRLSQEVAGLGYWDFDIASGRLVWSDRTRELLGAEPTEPAWKRTRSRCCRSRYTARRHGPRKSIPDKAPVQQATAATTTACPWSLRPREIQIASPVREIIRRSSA